MKDQTTAVITAGGNATRCGGGTPKALMQTRSTTYIEALLIEVVESGVNDVVIYCNRPSYLSEIEYISKQYCNPTIVLDKGVNSTFYLAKHAATICKGDDILFLYGHSPHPSDYIRKLVNCPHHAAVSLFEGSSKRKPIKWLEYGYIEPPFKISVNLLNISKHNDWISLFNAISNSIKCMPADAPSEFNNLEERKIFEQYLYSCIK